ncbi:universal stress protein [Nocardia huaxiensis]|uniref:Universal stress protein n=1 Tax=Nocardia huaxiensis TaxID=2755382 RepID=A0A7D6ZDV0_9NOCA|nr:universal stress protein [Nocardia huaxiensis]QLY28559.1 universal stress protein [Nocardia huaxiensis]
MADNADPAPRMPPIVAATDGSEISSQAVAWAAVEAQSVGSPLHIVTACVIPGFGDPVTAVRAAELAELRASSARVLAEARRIAENATPGADLAITTEFVLDPITPTLIDRSRHARMIVVGNRGRGAVRRAVLGSVSTALSRHAHCPVAVVHGVTPDEPVSATAPVVVGVDGSANCLPAVEAAFDAAARRKVPVLAVHAGHDTSGFDLEVRGWESVRRGEDERLVAILSDFVDRYPQVQVQRIIVCDTPVRALLRHAEQAQLLVVGSHGRGGFAAGVLGSVSTALLHYAPCPVLVVRKDSRHDT